MSLIGYCLLRIQIYIGLYEAISEWLEVVATVTLAVAERLLAPPGVDAARSAATTLR